MIGARHDDSIRPECALSYPMAREKHELAVSKSLCLTPLRLLASTRVCLPNISNAIDGGIATCDGVNGRALKWQRDVSRAGLGSFQTKHSRWAMRNANVGMITVEAAVSERETDEPFRPWSLRLPSPPHQDWNGDIGICHAMQVVTCLIHLAGVLKGLGENRHSTSMS